MALILTVCTNGDRCRGDNEKCVAGNGCGCAPGFLFNNGTGKCVCGKCNFTLSSGTPWTSGIFYRCKRQRRKYSIVQEPKSVGTLENTFALPK